MWWYVVFLSFHAYPNIHVIIRLISVGTWVILTDKFHGWSYRWAIVFFDTRVFNSTSDSCPASVRWWTWQSKCEPHGCWIVGLIYVTFLDRTVILSMYPGQLWDFVPSEVHITEHVHFIRCDPTRVLTNDSIDWNIWWTLRIGFCRWTIFNIKYLKHHPRLQSQIHKNT